ncbi:MAG UNVERIFIED_CONTAM: hypothetical protein LVR18_12235 [Planctomycetaceae bacterium]|jgi:hypothetical protein
MYDLMSSGNKERAESVECGNSFIQLLQPCKGETLVNQQHREILLGRWLLHQPFQIQQRQFKLIGLQSRMGELITFFPILRCFFGCSLQPQK